MPLLAPVTMNTFGVMVQGCEVIEMGELELIEIFGGFRKKVGWR
jgi:hypothetical protein